MFGPRPAEPAPRGSFRIKRLGTGESYFPMLQGDAEARPSSGALVLEFRTTTHQQRQRDMEGGGWTPFWDP